MTKKILITASTFPRYVGDNTVDFVWHQARYLKKHYPDYEIHTLVPHDKGAKKFEVVEGVIIHRYGYFWPQSWQTLVYPAIWPNIKEKPIRLVQVPFLLLSMYFAARRVVKKHQIDLIYSHWFTPQGLVCHKVAQQNNIPHVLTSHAADIIILKKLPWLGNKLVRSILPQFEKISFAGSRGMAQALEFFSGEQKEKLRQKCQVLPMGVDLQIPAKLLTEEKSKHKELKLLFVGRLAEKKGVTYLLNAMRLIKDDDKEITLDVLGEGPLLNEIKSEVKQLDLTDNVNFHGFVNGEDKFSFINNSDLFVLPSIVTDDGDAEGLPVSLLEAMAAGALCCASDESGAPDIVKADENALLFKAKSASALAEVFKKMHAMPNSQKKAIKENARLCGERYQWDNLIHEHAEYLFNLPTDAEHLKEKSVNSK